MATELVANHLDGPVLRTNALATVTADCLVIRDSARLSHTIIGLSELSGMRQVRTSHPQLLVIAAGIFLISAAAYCSKEGAGSGPYIASLGVAFAIAYLLSRRAAIAFRAGRDTLQTDLGSLHDAAALILAVKSAQLGSSSDVLLDTPADFVQKPIAPPPRRIPFPVLLAANRLGRETQIR